MRESQGKQPLAELPRYSVRVPEAGVPPAVPDAKGSSCSVEGWARLHQRPGLAW